MANREKFYSAKSPQPNNKGKAGQFRVIGGQWKGRKLRFMEVEGLRPSLDRVRETLFNWLQSEIRGARCLDLFAGSGSIGIEALSRGASHVDFVELNKKVVRQLETNLGLLDADNADVVHIAAEQYLERAKAQYDIVFIDPPFHKGMAQDIILKLERSSLLKPESLVYLEFEQGLELAVAEGWELLKDKKAGQLQYQLYRNGSA